MRVILIEEDRFVEITELLRLKTIALGETSNTPERLGWDRNIWKAAIEEASRTVNFHFVQWAQSHGASCVRR